MKHHYPHTKSQVKYPTVLLIILAFGLLAFSSPTSAAAEYQAVVLRQPRAPEIVGRPGVSIQSLPQITAPSSALAVVQQYTLSAPDPGARDEFGWAVAVDGTTAVVGSRNEDPDLGSGSIYNAGAAYVFTLEGDTWRETVKLTAKDPEIGDSFGVSVAISGNTILVGATGVDIEDGDDHKDDVGAVYVFVRKGDTWEQQAKLLSQDREQDDNFGTAVDLDGDWALIGASSADVLFRQDAGAAYVFKRSGRSWKQNAKLTAADPDLGDFLGTSVAIDGTTAVVGAPELNAYQNRGSGKAYVYTNSGGVWVQQDKLMAKDARQGDGFGHALAISGSRIIVGAHRSDPVFNSGRITSAGAAYIFARLGSQWEEEAKLIANDASNFDNFGQSVGISGNTVVIGADGKYQAGNISAGAAYVFRRQAGQWTQQTKAVAEPAYSHDIFGTAVSIDRNWVLVGASGRTSSIHSKAGEAFLIHLGEAELPDTGFAPGKITALPAQPEALAYQSYGELQLEIPALQVNIPIVGVAKARNGWDVRWLWEQAGYLDGTAFPTWQGNTGIAAHATLPNGQPGPFINLKDLRWGSEVVIHAWGQRYVYEVRESKLVRPSALTVLEHEELDWITLITCQGFDEATDSFRWRRVVRAVLVSIENE